MGSQAVAGTVYVKMDGQQFSVTGGCEVPITDYKREGVLPGYYKEEDRVPFVKVDALFTREFPLEKMQQASDLVVTVEFKNGRVYVLSDAYVTGEPTVSSDDGKVSLEFSGSKGRWQ